MHYRFGAFDGRTVLSNDGSYESMLEAPDGSLVPGTRKAWFSPPGWAVPPYDQAPSTAGSGSAVLLADRFVVRTAIRHGSKGGVYLGEDRSTGAEVVIKQARPHIGASSEEAPCGSSWWGGSAAGAAQRSSVGVAYRHRVGAACRDPSGPPRSRRPAAPAARSDEDPR